MAFFLQERFRTAEKADSAGRTECAEGCLHEKETENPSFRRCDTCGHAAVSEIFQFFRSKCQSRPGAVFRAGTDPAAEAGGTAWNLILHAAGCILHHRYLSGKNGSRRQSREAGDIYVFFPDHYGRPDLPLFADGAGSLRGKSAYVPRRDLRLSAYYLGTV